MKLIPFRILRQYLCPQHLFTWFTGLLAECRWKWFKTWAIKRLIRKYHVNLSEALSENVDDYPNFNSFFTRQLKPALRPIVQDNKQIASPADGCISQIGPIHEDSILQAKHFNYTTFSLLGGSRELAATFEGGEFMTVYLAPKDYHRVHIPLAGKLRETIYIPGKLFSVNSETVQAVPNLFTRNERLVCIFDTEIGPMAVILIGAMLVGHIETVWPLKHDRKKISTERYQENISLEKGAELGLFRMGSTVIVLFPKNKMQWNSSLQEGSRVLVGQGIGNILT